MKSSRLVLTLGLAATAATAFALPPFLQTFQSTYKVPKGSALASAKCATCHVGTTTKMNPYGADVKKALEAKKTKTLTADILKKVENLDSDKDGAKNLAEIKAGTLPGDSKSKPAKSPAKKHKKGK